MLQNLIIITYYFPNKPIFFRLMYYENKSSYLMLTIKGELGYWVKMPKKLIRTDKKNAIVKYYKKNGNFGKKKK